MDQTIAPLTSHQVARLLLQLALILVTARALAELARRLGQPAVLGELLAGVLLGPTVLGAVVPGVSEVLFPKKEIAFKILEAISWLGMVLLLFLIGAETDVRSLRRLGRAALLVACVGLVVPLASGLLVGALLPGDVLPATSTRAMTAWFLATALAISAMPVIAKILVDLGLAQRDIGVVILGASVFDDTVGWMLLAVIVGLADPAASGPVVANVALTVAFLAGFLVAARFVLHPVLKRATRLVDDHFHTPGSDVALYASFAFACAALTDKLGIHAVFGAFVAGTLVRQVPRLRHEALERLEAVVGSVLAPVFFAFVGLKVNLLAGGRVGLMLVVLVVAVATKLLGCFVGGRLGGLGAREALVVGAGMSARGAMGLVVAVVGLSSGILSAELYSVIVVMSIGTSLLAPVLLRLLARGLPLNEHERLRFEDRATKRVLDLRAPKFLVPTAGGPNALLAVAIAARFCNREGATLTVLHVEHPRRPALGIPAHLDALRKTAFQQGANLATQKVVSEDVGGAVLGEARKKDVLLIGASNRSRAIYEPPVEVVLRNSPCHAVVVCARTPPEDGRFRRLLVPMDGSLFARVALEFAIGYAQRESSSVELVHVLKPRSVDVLHAGPEAAEDAVSAEAERVRATLKANLAGVLAALGRPVEIHVVRGADPTRAVLDLAEREGHDLLVVGAENRAVGEHLFLGYGTEALLEQSPCSAAVVIPRL